jgi:hypothetical protein
MSYDKQPTNIRPAKPPGRTSRRWAGLLQLDARLYVLAFAFFVIAALCWTVVVQIPRLHDLQLQNAINANENLARTIEEHVAGTVRSTDETLLVLAREFLRQGKKNRYPGAAAGGTIRG